MLIQLLPPSMVPETEILFHYLINPIHLFFVYMLDDLACIFAMK